MRINFRNWGFDYREREKKMELCYGLMSRWKICVFSTLFSELWLLIGILIKLFENCKHRVSLNQWRQALGAKTWSPIKLENSYSKDTKKENEWKKTKLLYHTCNTNFPLIIIKAHFQNGKCQQSSMTLRKRLNDHWIAKKRKEKRKTRFDEKINR